MKITQTKLAGERSGTHKATVKLDSGDYIIKYNASDLAGNVSKTWTFPVTIDSVAPTVTVNDGATYTVASDGTYSLVSFKLYDKGQMDKLTLNGKVKDLTNNAWWDLTFVKPGAFGGVRGENTLVVYDVAGNTTTVRFTLE